MADALPMRGRMIHPGRGGARLPALLARRRPGDQLDQPRRPQPCPARRCRGGAGRRGRSSIISSSASIRRAGAMTFETPSGKALFDADVVIGADGAGSAVRGQLLGAGAIDERLDFLDYGYKELHIPPQHGEFALDPAALHIWPRGSSMMIALPNPDRSFTCTLFWPNGGSGCFAALSSPAAIDRHFRSDYPDFVPLAPTLVDDYQHNPVGLLGTVHASPWHAAGRVGLLGDAAHAIVPFYGQGANCAFEDVVELDRCLDETGGRWAVALPLFEHRRRRDNTEAIAAMALGQLRRDARQGGVAGVPAGEAGRARSGTGCCPVSTCRGTSWCRSPRRRTPKCAGESAASTPRSASRPGRSSRCHLSRDSQGLAPRMGGGDERSADCARIADAARPIPTRQARRRVGVRVGHEQPSTRRHDRRGGGRPRRHGRPRHPRPDRGRDREHQRRSCGRSERASSDLVTVTTYLVDMTDFAGYNEVYGRVLRRDVWAGAHDDRRPRAAPSAPADRDAGHRRATTTDG